MGDLVLRVSIDPNLKQQPTSIRMVNPTTGAVCGILPEKLGLCVLTQEVNPDNCWTEYMWRHTTFYDAVLNSGCFIELPNVTESGPGFTVISRAFKTIYEVELSGYAPFGQDATKKRSETVLTRILRREYTYIVATQLQVESNDFAVVADGLIQYRLVGIDVAPTKNQGANSCHCRRACCAGSCQCYSDYRAAKLGAKCSAESVFGQLAGELL